MNEKPGGLAAGRAVNAARGVRGGDAVARGDSFARDFHTMMFMPDTTIVSEPDDRYVMKVSRNGQISIPASARARWRSDRVVVVDLGDRLLVRPLADDPISSLRGKYRSQGPSTRALRDRARTADAARERRKRT